MSYFPKALRDEMLCGTEGTEEVVGNDLVCFYFIEDAVEKNNRQPFIMELFQVGKINGFA